jgi:hypothetical protein
VQRKRKGANDEGAEFLLSLMSWWLDGKSYVVIVFLRTPQGGTEPSVVVVRHSFHILCVCSVVQNIDVVVSDPGGGTRRGRMLMNVNRFDPLLHGT